MAHGIYADRCGAAVIASFFDNPQQPDTSCINSTAPPPYAITPPHRDGDSTVSAGRSHHGGGSPGIGVMFIQA
ncbi:putative hydrolase domain protein [Mycobacterium kansasii 824]|nr:putative hydrolase domain protein [Mycobacterium kansasii 824]